MNKIPTESKFVTVFNSKMHYLESGMGDPILFVHGIPTSSYIWRKVIELMNHKGRCIAVDLIGLGKSDKPDITYSITDHVNYLTGFIEALNLKNITLVLHAWGSLAGFTYAMTHQNNVKGLIFYESYIRPVLDWSMLSLPMQELVAIVNQAEYKSKIANTDYFIDSLLPRAILKDMPKEGVEIFRAALAETKNRQPLMQYLPELPTGSEPQEVTNLMRDYSHKLEHSSVPKLMIYGVPGYNTTIATVAWARDHLPKLTIADIGAALHFAQEINPTAFSEAILEWQEKILVASSSLAAH